MISITERLSEDEVQALEAKWKARVDGTVKPSIYYEPNSPFMQLVGFVSDITPKDPTAVVCSFCKTPTPYVTATLGTGKPRKVVTDHIIIVNGIKTIQENVSYRVQKLVACPKCVLEIEPLVDAYGDVMKNTIQFPTTE
jgi:hypothetical protein